jgi:ParB family transcriptional regulator, chromosome partitioning protein
MPEMKNIALDKLMVDPAQPRKFFLKDAIERLASSIVVRGVLQALRVRWDEERQCWLIVTGESRYRAAKLAGLTDVPCLVIDGELSEADILADRLTENMVRQDLSPIDEANGLMRLKLLKGCTAKALAQEYGFSGASIARGEALLSLPAQIQQMVGDGPGQIKKSTAYEISRLPDADAQLELAQAVADRRVTRDQAAETVRSEIGKRNVRPKASRLSCRMEGGISLTVSAGGPLTWEILSSVLDRLQRETKKLKASGQDISALAQALRAS